MIISTIYITRPLWASGIRDGEMKMGKDFQHGPAEGGFSGSRCPGDDEQQPFLLHLLFHRNFTAEHAEMKMK
jgi:hypothetical protein